MQRGTEIIAPPHAPDWASDRSELWNRVEEAETRKNSQVAREVRIALPDELTHAQRVALVRDYAQAQFVDRGMVADIALHAPRKATGRRCAGAGGTAGFCSTHAGFCSTPAPGGDRN